MKARKRKTYYELLDVHRLKRDKAAKRLDELVRQTIRLALRMHKYRQEARGQQENMNRDCAAIDRGELYPPLVEKKPKPGRRMELQ